MMKKKITHTLLYAACISGIIFLLGFAADQGLRTPCIGPFISIESRSGNYFIHTEAVYSIITEHFNPIEEQPISQNELRRMHTLINNIPYVEKANVFRANTGKLGVEIMLRDPVIRVINRDNDSYYIDKNGYMFPLSDTHTARVMLATGSISVSYNEGFNVTRTDADDVEASLHDLSNLFRLATFIHNDPFWKAFIDHIYLLPDGKFELTPKNGAHIIEFGKASEVEKKFRKLKLFYLNSLTLKGWHYYNRINLEYRNQVICSK